MDDTKPSPDERAARPGVVNVRDEQAARFDERIADKRYQSEMGAKPPPVTTRPQQQLESLEERIVAKSRGMAPEATTQAGAVDLRMQENEILAKAGMVPNGMVPNGRSGPSDLSGFENEVLATMPKGNSLQNEIDRLDERIAAKNNMFRPRENLMENAKEPSKAGFGDSMGPEHAPQKDDLHEGHADPLKADQAGPTTPTDEAVTQGANDLEFGIIGADLDDNELAVAVPVEENDDDVFIPSAVEYDPDAKPPIYKTRRFRLYAFLALFVLIVLTVVAIVVILSKADDGGNDPTPAPTSYRDTLGIRARVQSVVGSETLEDNSSPYKKALDWIMYDDPLELLPDAPNFVQRYLAAYLYFATTVDKPWFSCNPPKDFERDSCEYMQLISTEPPERISIPWYRWLSGRHECEWASVYCDNAQQIRSFDFAGVNMTGAFPTGIKYFPFLQSFSSIYGELRGTIPTEIADMKHLVNLELHINELTGAIPQELWSSRNLQRLNLGGNRLVGELTREMDKLSDLKGLYLNNNKFSGEIPTTVGKLSSLSNLYLQRNILVGSIPTVFGSLPHLRTLWLHRNQFTGSIPTQLGNLTRMINLRLQNNLFTGSLPDELFNLVNLNELDVHDCRLTGTISTKIGQLTNLDILRISGNPIDGTVPTEMGLIEGLTLILLTGTDLTGTVPTEVCGLREQPTFDLEADCLPSDDDNGEEFIELECSCCTQCCDSQGELCVGVED